jgi:glycosidase
MSDLNQKNSFLLNYFIQNSIWWIEYAGIDGIRMDTYPYPDKNAMAVWAKTIMEFYPTFTILGEVWQQTPPHTAYWQDNERNKDEYRSWIPSVTDFPTYYALKDGLMEEENWTNGFRRLYYVLAQDFLYSNADMLTIFPDNHDLDRFYTSIDEDFKKYKIGIAYILTTRGIPQIYYGTEILMTGNKSKSHGYIREDFPGGWGADTVNAFTGDRLSSDQLEAQNYMSKLLNWRKKTPAVTEGKFTHFIPKNDIYVYFRHTESQKVMIILNKNDKRVDLNTVRYSECMNVFNEAVNVLTDEVITGLNVISVPAMSALILEMKE